jgi:ribosomal protein S18 acetylase RimI-like enzyme
MGVLPEFRGQGLGQRLLESCMAIARQVGVTRVELETRSDNEQALSLYRRMGFQFEGVKRRGIQVDGEYEDTTTMALLL